MGRASRNDSHDHPATNHENATPENDHQHASWVLGTWKLGPGTHTPCCHDNCLSTAMEAATDFYCYRKPNIAVKLKTPLHFLHLTSLTQLQSFSCLQNSSCKGVSHLVCLPSNPLWWGLAGAGIGGWCRWIEVIRKKGNH